MSLVAPIDELIAVYLADMKKMLATAREATAEPPSPPLCRYLELILQKVDVCKSMIRTLMDMKEDMLTTERRMKAVRQS
jgi:hypothetical protein